MISLGIMLEVIVSVLIGVLISFIFFILFLFISEKANRKPFPKNPRDDEFRAERKR